MKFFASRHLPKNFYKLMIAAIVATGTLFVSTHRVLAYTTIFEQIDEGYTQAHGGWDQYFVSQQFHTDSSVPVAAVQIKVANAGVEYINCNITNGWFMSLSANAPYYGATSSEHYLFSNPEFTVYTFTFAKQIPANQISTIKLESSDFNCQLPYWQLQNLLFAGNIGNPYPGYTSSEFHDSAGPSSSVLTDFDMWFRVLGGDEATAKTPVLIIPGILGSAQKDGTWVIDPILHTYDNLIDTLKANGFEENKDLFTFPYNWYQSNVITALELEAKINQVKHICQCSKVDIVAHSMGGLVARQYIQSERYNDDVDNMIFLGTPHLGAPKAYLAWEGGETGTNIQDQLLKFILSREGKKFGFKTVFDYIRNKPILSVRELLPVYSYLKDIVGQLKIYPTNYPQNVFLENLEGSADKLSNLDIKITNIIGNAGAQSTINMISVIDPYELLPLWEHGKPLGWDLINGDHGLEMGEGDGTVPLESSSAINGIYNEFAVGHSDIPTIAEGFVVKTLTGHEATILVNNHHVISVKLLIFKMLSPADMQVVAPDGKKIGKDFTTNQEINEIPDAFYSGFETDDEYVTIINPLDGEYKLIIQGTGKGGEYTVATGFISDSFDVETDITAQSTPGLITDFNASIDNSNPENLKVTPEDNTPPKITILSPENRDYPRSENVVVDTSVEDVDSGVLSSEIKLDNITVSNGQSIDLFYQTLGTHNLTVNACDNVNNQGKVSQNFRIVATYDSTISDTERAFSLGWINKKSIKNDLINKLNKALKLEKRIDFIEEQLPGKAKVIKRVERIEKRIDKVLGKALLKDLEKQKGKEISLQAYNLLSEDINWLINN